MSQHTKLTLMTEQLSYYKNQRGSLPYLLDTSRAQCIHFQKSIQNKADSFFSLKKKKKKSTKNYQGSTSNQGNDQVSGNCNGQNAKKTLQH